ALEVGQSHFCVEMLSKRREAALGQAALQRHLTAFKTDLVEAAGAGLLTLVTTATSLAQTGADTATDAAAGMLGALCRLQRIELSFRHADSFRLPRRRRGSRPSGSCRALQAYRPGRGCCSDGEGPGHARWRGVPSWCR